MFQFLEKQMKRLFLVQFENLKDALPSLRRLSL